MRHKLAHKRTSAQDRSATQLLTGQRGTHGNAPVPSHRRHTHKRGHTDTGHTRHRSTKGTHSAVALEGSRARADLLLARASSARPVDKACAVCYALSCDVRCAMCCAML